MLHIDSCPAIRRFLTKFRQQSGNARRTIRLVVETYSEPVIMESLFSLLIALQSGQIEGNPAKYLLGILKNKKREETEQPARTNKSTEEKLMDRSWMKGLNLADLDDWTRRISGSTGQGLLIRFQLPCTPITIGSMKCLIFH